MFVECKICGKTFEQIGSRTVYCSAVCSFEGEKIKRKERYLNRKMKNCAICGKPFQPTGTQKYCSAECKLKGKQEYERNYKRTGYSKKSKVKKPENSLDAIAKRAREAGMSYGQYVLSGGQ